ncbi:hypothetical protein STSO111631_21430 [Stackebrandtia soli]
MKVRFSEAERERVASVAAERRMMVAMYVAAAALSEATLATETDDVGIRVTALRELMRAHRQLRGACTNLNQIAHCANVGGAAGIDIAYLEATAEELVAAARAVHAATRDLSR